MNVPDNAHNETGSPQVTKPKTEEKYREAIELYRTTQLSCAEICRTCKVTVSGFQRYLFLYHHDLLLARYNITCSKAEARHIKLGPLRRQLPATRAKYKDAIEACESLDYIEYNVSQIAREFGLNGTNLGRQLRTHYPGVIEWRETVRERLGLGDNLPRGTRRYCKELYAEAVKLLRANRYITVQEAADTCGVSYTGLEQHLLFYHKDRVFRNMTICFLSIQHIDYLPIAYNRTLQIRRRHWTFDIQKRQALEHQKVPGLADRAMLHFLILILFHIGL